MRRLSARIAVVSLVLMAAALVSIVAVRSQSDDRSVLASLISRALTTPATRVSIGAVQGALSSDATVRNITIADKDGVWLELDRARLIWTRSALLFGRLEIDRLELGTLTIRRKPAPAEEPVAGADQPILPELPVKVTIKAFTLAELALGAAYVGVDAKVTASGAASLGAPSEGLDLRLDARRLDAPGTAAVRLSLVPQGERLTLSLKLDEPERGLFAHAANVPGHPPVKLDLDGSGTLDAFNAQLTFTAGPTIGANGSAQLARTGGARRLTLGLAAQIEGLLPELAAPVFAGTTRLDGTVAFADGGAIDISPLTVQSQTARLDLAGSLSAEQVADLKVSVRNLPNAGNRTAAGGAELGSLAFDATIAGPLLGPRVEATLAARDARLPQVRLATLDARFTATPDGSVTTATTAIPFNASARATGVVATDPAMRRAIGDALTLTASGTFQDGVVTTDNARIETPTANATFSGQAGQPRLQGRLTATAPDLTRFGALAGLDLRGALNARADLSGVPKEGRVEAAVDARIDRFATGLPAVDGLAGGRLALAGTLRQLPRGGYGFADLRLDGAHASARLNGDATVDAADIDARVAIPDLRRADARLSGRADATAKVTGTLERLGATANILVVDARALGRPIPRLALDVVGQDITGAPDLRLTLAGTVDGKPAQGRAHLAAQPDSGWRVDGLDVAVGSVSTRGDLTLTAERLAEGRLAVDARNLDDLSPLVLTKLAGRLQADLALAVANGGQNGNITATAQGVKLGDAAIDRMNARAAVTDAWRRPVLDADVSIDRAVFAGETFSQIRLTATGRTDASDIALTAQAREMALDARGRLVPADNIRLELAAFNARRGSHRIALANPTTLTLVDEGVDIRNLVLTIDSGRLQVNGRAGSTLDLTLAARAVPLAATAIAMPSLGVSGTLDGDAQLRGTSAQPTGTWRLRVARLTTSQVSGLPPVDVSAEGRLADGRTTVDGTLRAGNAGTMKVTGSVPLDGDGLDLAVNGRLDLAVGNALLGVGGRSVGGRADVDARLRGSFGQPQVTGGATISGASYTDDAFGVKLTGISGRLAARGEELVIERLSAQTPGGGTITAQGQVRIDPAAGFPGTIRVRGQNAKLASNDVVDAVANLSLDMSGPLASDPRLSGRIDFTSLQVTIPERLPDTLRPIPGTRHVNPSPAVARRLAAEARARSRAGRKPPFDAQLDLVISAPNRVFVRGRGIDAELGGELKLSGRLSEPVSVGAFDLRRGRMAIAGARLDFTRGRLAFTGDLSPDLDLLAQTRAGDVTAQIAINGPAAQPSFTFSSEPDLPQDEVISRLLFNKASGGLSPIQAVQLANVAAQFSGGGGPGVFENLRKSLGVDSLDISTSASGDPTVGVSRAIGNRLSVGVKSGARPEDTAVSVDIDVTRRVRVQTEVGATGEPAVGIGAEWEY